MLGVLLISVIILYLVYQFYWRRRCYPPGPTPLPIIGNLYMMKAELKPGYKLWQNLRSEYGPVFTFWLGNLPTIVVTDWELIKNSFIKDGNSYTGRPVMPMTQEFRGGAYGLAEAVGDRWIQHKKFTLHVFRNFGLGKNLMEEKIIEEVRSMIKSLKEHEGPIDMETTFDSAIGSIINSVLFGYRFNSTNITEFTDLKSKMAKYFTEKGTPIGTILLMVPWLGNLPYFSQHKQMFARNWNSVIGVFRKQINERLKTIDYESDDYSDYVEAFLKEQKKNEHIAGYGGYEMEQLESSCYDLWIAGVETTATTLYWSLLYVLRNPEIRRKIYDELDLIIDNDRIITTSDRNSLHYINATITETQRLANLLPSNAKHEVINDVEIGGFKIDKGMTVVPQISMVMYDDKIFPNPYEFNPSRFIDENGHLTKTDEVVPFSVGKRNCLGEGLARLELFLVFANLFNQFYISFDPYNPNPSIDKEYGVTVRAKNFKVLLAPRKF